MKTNRLLSLLLAVSFLAMPLACEVDNTDDPDKDKQNQQNENPDQTGNNENQGENNGENGDNNQEGQPDFSPEAWYSTNYWERTDREKEGLRGPVKEWHNTHYTSYDLYEYDRAGHLTKETSYNNSGEISAVTLYTYDSEGRRIKEVHTNEDGSYIDSEVTYEYGNPGKMVVSQTYIFHDAVLVGLTGRSEAIIPGLSAIHETRANSIQYTAVEDQTFTFDEDGNLSIRRYSRLVDNWNDGAILDGTESDYTYKWIYSNGYPSYTDPDNPSGHYVTSITWQSNGMPLSWDSKIKETTYTWMGEYRIDHCEWYENAHYLAIKDYQHVSGYVGGYLDDYWRKNEFDDHDELIHAQFDKFDDGTHFDYYYTDYKYDSHGNWISRKEDITGVLDGNRDVSVVEREIIYY